MFFFVVLRLFLFYALHDITNSNQSARELSHFAESAMAVKRVIMQHFSMKYDYMNKERPNIYHPSRAGVRADPSITNPTIAVNNRTISDDDDSDDLLHNNSNQSTPNDNQMGNSENIDVNGTMVQYDHLNHDDGCNGKLYENRNGERMNDLDCDLSSRKVPATKMHMPSIEEQLNDAVRSLNEHQLKLKTTPTPTTPSSNVANRRSQTALKMYATSNGLRSIIEKLSVDDSDTNGSIDESPFKKPQVIVNNSGLDANAKHVPSSNIRHEIKDSQASMQKKPMAINTRNNIRPEENWRYRSNSNSLESKQPPSK